MQLTDISPDRRALLASLELQAPQTRLNGHQIIAGHLKAWGVTHVYGISGTPVDETLAACGRRGMRVVATRHQQAAVQAAAAHNFLAGGLRAVVVVSAGPGVSNCATGITVARDNHWPVLVIGGRRPVAMREMGTFQELDGRRLFESITKHAALVESAGELAGLLDHACKLTMQGQPGPCYLDVAEEALHGKASCDDAALPHVCRPVPGIDWTGALDAICRARRPVLIVGEDVRWGDPWEALTHLVETYRIPFVTSPMARGFLPDSHALCGSRVRSWLLGEADLVLMTGASLDWVFRHGAEIHPEASLIRFGFETDSVFQARKQATEFLGNPAALLQGLVSALQACSGRIEGDGNWLRDLALHKRAYEQRLAEACRDKATPMTPACWPREVAAALPEDAVTIVDGNVAMAWAQHLLPAERPLSRLTPGANGCMGIGVPYSLAACLARPDRPVLVVSGDFALGLNLMDLETAVRHRLPLVVIVANNSGSGGSLRQKAYWPADYPERICQFMPGIRYDQIMQALGGEGEWIERVEDVAPAIGRAFSNARPALIQIDTRDDIPLPRL